MPYEEQYYGKLTGKKVHKVVHADPEGGDKQCYGLQFTDGTIAWIMCDPEGNGPGHLDIQTIETKHT